MERVDSAFGGWPNGPRPTIKDFGELLKALPSDLTESDVLRPKLRLYADNVISVYFTPFPSVNRTGRVFLVGLTPGRHQHWLATVTAASALWAGNSPRAAAIKAGSVGSFAGPMRTNLVRQLDGVGLAAALGVETTAELWTSHEHLRAATSALPHAVILTASGRNYTGHVPKIERHPVLSSCVDRYLSADLAAAPDALVVPLGQVVSEAVRRVGVDPERVLFNMPHPSGANGHRARLYAEHQKKMAAAVRNWF
jgi:hypothetical protein